MRARSLVLSRLRSLAIHLTLGFSAVYANGDSALPVKVSIPESQSLEDALAAVHLRNPELQSQRAIVSQKSKEVLSVARAQWLPSFSASSSIGTKWQHYRFTGLFVFDEEGTIQPKELQATLEQPVYRGGRAASIDRAKAIVRAEIARLDVLEQQLLAAAANAYLAVATNQAIERLRQEDVEDARKILEHVQLRYASGGATRTDIYQSEARLGRSMAELSASAAQTGESLSEYERIIGVVPGKLAIPARIVDAPASLAEALNEAMTRNPALIAAIAEKEAASYEISTLRGELLPSLDLKLNYWSGKDSYIPNIGSYGPKEVTEKSAMLVATFPLYQPGLLSRISGARHSQRATTYQLHKVEGDVGSRVKRDWIALQTAQMRFRQMKLVVDSSLNALKGVKLEHEAGSRTVFDVLTAEQDLLGSRVAMTQAAMDCAAASVSLSLTTGRFTLDKLRKTTNSETAIAASPDSTCLPN